jgi:predicted ATPase/DNA-binding SARP family transcriptional activator
LIQRTFEVLVAQDKHLRFSLPLHLEATTEGGRQCQGFTVNGHHRTMAELALHLLGSPRVERDGEEIHIGRRKAFALLAYLALTAQRHQRDALATLLWPGYDQSSARAHLRRALATITKRLGAEWLDANRETLGLNPGAAIWLDVKEFERRLAECETHGHPLREVCQECPPALEKALELYQDDFMAGFSLPDSLPFDDWQRFQTEVLRQTLVSGLERLVHGLGSQGADEAAISYARRWLELAPADEVAHRALMGLYARTGQISAALRQYKLCTRALADELDAPPTAETQGLYERVRSGDMGAAESESRPTPLESPERLAAPPHNLMAPATPFVGREQELADLENLIADPEVRLITIVGPGGMGKTRLALAAAQQQLEATVETSAYAAPRFPDGVFFVSLAPLSSAEHIIPTLTEALNFQVREGAGETRSRARQVHDYLREKRMLVILDNFEHLLSPSAPPPFPPAGRIGEGAKLLAEVVRTAPGVQVLVTSREPLHLQGEKVFSIKGLACPDWAQIAATPTAADTAHAPEEVRGLDVNEYSAALLFVLAARRVHHDFELVAHDAAALTDICRLVDGMPLGIELAASWVDTLSLADIAGEIERGLAFLETPLRDVPDRHRSIQAVFDASWRRLSDAQQDAFAQLSVFRGGFTRAAAQAVISMKDGELPTLHPLAALVRKSLLRYDKAKNRYQVHELLRQYGAGKLATLPEGAADVQARHSAYYCAALGDWEAELKNVRQTVALDEIELDLDNVRVAWEWAATQRNVPELDQSLNGYVYFHRLCGSFYEGIDACQLAIDALTRVGATSTTFPDALRVAAMALVLQAELYELLQLWRPAKTRMDRAQALLNSPALVSHDTRAERAMLLRKMGQAAMPDREQARQLLNQGLSLYRLLGDRHGEAWSLAHLGLVHLTEGDLRSTKRLYEESLALLRSLGDAFGTAALLDAFAGLAVRAGDYAEAKRLHSEVRAICRVQGYRNMEAWYLMQLGQIHRACGDQTAARHVFVESLALSRKLNMPRLVCYALVDLGDLALDAYDVNAARQWFEKALEYSQTHNYPPGLAVALASVGRLALFEGRFEAGRDHLRQSVAAGRALEDWARPALRLAYLAAVQCWSGAFGRARGSIAQALALADEMGFRPQTAFLRLCRAQIEAYVGRYEEARAQAVEALVLAHGMRFEKINHIDLFAFSPHLFNEARLNGFGRGLQGWAALGQGQDEAALEAFQESLTALREIGDREQEAWVLAGIGRAAHRLGRLGAARAHLLQGLNIAFEISGFIPLLYLMPIVSVLLADEEENALRERAVELYALAESQPFIAKAQLFEDVAGAHIQAITHSLPPDVVEAAKARGQARDWWETAEELLDELKALGWAGSQ